jgi:hypothetical protein
LHRLGGYHLIDFFLAVTADTTIGWIKDYLEQNGHISTTSAMYFTAGRRRASISDTMESLGLGELSHLRVNLIVPGGASRRMDIGTFTFIFVSYLIWNLWQMHRRARREVLVLRLRTQPFAEATMVMLKWHPHYQYVPVKHTSS